MSAKVKRYTLYVVCAVLCWALVFTPCFYSLQSAFAGSGNAVRFSVSAAAVPSDKVSLPPVISQLSDSGSGSSEMQDVPTSDKVLASLPATDSVGNTKPTAPAVKDVVDTPVSKPVTTPVVNETDITSALLSMPDGSSFTYYEQTWPAYTDYPYGYNTVGGYGCGPTSMAMVISNLTDVTVSPKYMADWSYNNGYYVSGRGTAYGLFPAASAAFGIKCSTISCYDKSAVVSALQSGKLLITVVGYGDFTRGRHFLLIRGITEDGKLLLADSGKYENCLVEWDYTKVISQVANSYFWVFEK